MDKKLFFLAVSLSALIALSGCAPDTGKQSAQSISPKAASSQSVKTPAEASSTLTYYRISDDGLRIIPTAIKVKASDHTARNSLEEMIRTDRKSKYPLLPAGLSLKTISIKDGRAYVNFSKELNSLKGETAESLFIAMTVDTLTEFPNIREVEIKADGKAPKFQMDMTKTFKRDESYIQMEKK
ncbi:GerMN domain-containing protein [uncultured Dialister sp.]|jgi:germination protein M|uniref:GerMN domain-containing protein n=1 Tax=Dialister sp. TaxID=1955814 RepID=UPI0025ED7070|nr:GerMN domain-containing protein [uncultured Dialister sp.]